MAVTFRGRVTRIHFKRDDFVIARFRTIDDRNQALEEITFKGELFDNFNEGDLLVIRGDWAENGKFGPTLVLTGAEFERPIDAKGQFKYLVDRVPGIGEIRAKLLIDRFGNVYDVLDKTPERILEIRGIGKPLADRIIKNWREDNVNRSLNSFLAEIGVGQTFTAKILKELGNDAETIIRENPYKLIDVHGLGFKRADEIARQLGLGKDSTARANAILVHLLEKARNEGHVYLPAGDLLLAASEECNIPEELAEQQLDLLAKPRSGPSKLIRVGVTTGVSRYAIVYLPPLYEAEKKLAKDLVRLIDARPRKKFELSDINFAIGIAEKKVGLTLNDKQRQAVRTALTSSITVLTGGPGTGKTSALRVLVQAAKALSLRFSLAAPTGRAAKRMNEVTGEPASTIHRLLQFSQKKGGFTKGRGNTLDIDLLILDETSMLDVSLANSTLEAIPAGSSVLFVGDPNQLPSVGPGRVLGDLIDSGRVPTIKLTEIFRQAQKSLIVKNAYNILNGNMPQFFDDPQGKTGPLSFDCYLCQPRALEGRKTADPEHVKALLAKLTTESIPKKLKIDPIRDIQVLVPQKTGRCGVHAINRRLQDILNPRPEEQRAFVGGREYRVGDRVMNVANNDKLQVYNGDIGFILRFDPEDKIFVINFEASDGTPREVVYPFEDSKDLLLAYATTVHKAQGSEYKVVIAVVLKDHFMMLRRNLLYTAITRARDLLVFISTPDALAMSIGNDRVEKRYSLLESRLRNSKQEKAA